jgi:hypothetical protein
MDVEKKQTRGIRGEVTCIDPGLNERLRQIAKENDAALEEFLTLSRTSVPCSNSARYPQAESS